MRTAEEILNSHHWYGSDTELDFDGMVKIINEARKEAIEASAASLIDYNAIGVDRNKQSILSLLDELK